MTIMGGRTSDSARPTVLLAVAVLLLATASPGARGDAGPPSPASGSPRIDLPEGEAYRKIIKLELEQKPLAEVLAHLCDEHDLSVEAGPAVEADACRLTIGLRASVPTILCAIATGLGDDFRWRRRGETLVLDRAAPKRWTPAVARDTVRALQSSLVGAGLMPDVPADVWLKAPVGLYPSPLEREGKAARMEEAAAAFAATTGPLFDPEVLGNPRGRGVPIAALPPRLQQQALAIVVNGTRVTGMRGAALGAAMISANPLICGEFPPGVKLRKNDGRWLVDYGARGGPFGDTFPLDDPPQ